MKSMMTTFGILLALSVFASISQAATDPVRCAKMERVVQDHKKWSVGFEKFMGHYDQLSQEDKFKTSVPGTRRVLQDIENLRDLAGVNVNESLVEEAFMDLDNASLGDLSKPTANALLKNKMVQLKSAMADMTFAAQAKNPECNLGTVNSPQI
jgi:hypothetical protein